MYCLCAYVSISAYIHTFISSSFLMFSHFLHPTDPVFVGAFFSPKTPRDHREKTSPSTPCHRTITWHGGHPTINGLHQTHLRKSQGRSSRKNNRTKTAVFGNGKIKWEQSKHLDTWTKLWHKTSLLTLVWAFGNPHTSSTDFCNQHLRLLTDYCDLTIPSSKQDILRCPKQRFAPPSFSARKNSWKFSNFWCLKVHSLHSSRSLQWSLEP